MTGSKTDFEYERVKKLVPTMDERMRDAQDKIRLEQLERRSSVCRSIFKNSFCRQRARVTIGVGKDKDKEGAAVAAPLHK